MQINAYAYYFLAAKHLQRGKIIPDIKPLKDLALFQNARKMFRG